MRARGASARTRALALTHSPHDFLPQLYQTLSDGRVGAFESPTGTVSSRDRATRARLSHSSTRARAEQGKSLSVICSAMLWRKVCVPRAARLGAGRARNEARNSPARGGEGPVRLGGRLRWLRWLR